MSTHQEREYIKELMREIQKDFERWAKEYQQERDLGALGEFANLYRKVRKLKTLMWPGENSTPAEPWREDLRTIAKEVVAHGLLLLTDLDKANGTFGKWVQAGDDEQDFTVQGRRADIISRRESRAKRLRLKINEEELAADGEG